MPTFQGTLASKLPKVGTTIFTVMSKLATDHNAVNLSQGFPDFGCSEELVRMVNDAMQAGHNQYAPMQGLPQLREVISEKTAALHGATYNPNTEITVTAGATQAIYTAITAVVKEGDEVIIFTPAYDCYEPTIELNGGKVIFVQLKTPEYNIDWEEVKKVVNRKTRMIIINTPHNPTGSILTATDMEELDRLTSETDILVLSDEVYEHIIFDGKEHASVSKYPGLADRSFVVASFGKTFHVTGWKMGYCLAPEHLMAEFQKVHQFNVFACNRPMQHALANYLSNAANYEELPGFYQKKRDVFNQVVEASRFRLTPAAGTYFQVLDYSDITDEKDTDYAIRLTKEFGIASIPVSVFYHKMVDHKVLRFCFAKNEETLEKAGEILCKI
jgi:methionine aminotransferase